MMPNINDDKKYKLEADLTKKVKVYLESLAPDGKFTKVSDRFHPGISDFIGCYKGKFVAIELKSETGEPTLHQIQYIAEVIKAGGYGVIARTVGEVKKLIASVG